MEKKTEVRLKRQESASQTLVPHLCVCCPLVATLRSRGWNWSQVQMIQVDLVEETSVVSSTQAEQGPLVVSFGVFLNTTQALQGSEHSRCLSSLGTS